MTSPKDYTLDREQHTHTNLGEKNEIVGDHTQLDPTEHTLIQPKMWGSRNLSRRV